MELADNPLSLVLAMAYPGPGNSDGMLRGLPAPRYLLESLGAVLDDGDFAAIELPHVKDRELRSRAAALLKKSKKLKLLCGQPVQLVNEERLIDPADLSSIQENERRKAVARIVALLDEAAEFGCTSIAVYSGTDISLTQHAAKDGWDAGRDGDAAITRASQWRSLTRSLIEICGEAAKKKMQVLLETFDRRSNAEGRVNYKTALAGPAAETAELCERLDARGVTNFGIMYDSAHMVLLGETPDALDLLAPWLKWVHLSNAVMDLSADDARVRSGDAHPVFGVPGSCVTPAVLGAFVRKLIEIDYTGPIGFEIKPVAAEEPADALRVAKAYYDEARGTADAAFVLSRGFAYSTRSFFTEPMFAEINRLRVEQPELIAKELAARKRRPKLTKDGYLVILAADHPARLATGIPGDPAGLGNRLDFLGRIVRVLAVSNIDGVMATADVIEDLVLANYLYKQLQDGKSFLDQRVLAGCVNRSGLAGAVAEMMDRETSYLTAKRIVDANLDAAKIMWRFPIDERDKNDRFAIETMERTAKFCADCHDRGVPVLLEPIAVRIDEKERYRFSHDPNDVIRMVGAANGLSHTTADTWIKIPFTPDYARVVRATTLPILMLGGESTGRPAATIEDFVRGMGSGPNVRGALVGRNVLYPGRDDPAAIAEAVQLVVHKGCSARDAIAEARRLRGTQMDLFV